MSILLTAIIMPFMAINSYGQVNEYGIKLEASSLNNFSGSTMHGRSMGISAFVDIQINEPFFTTFDFGITQRGFRDEDQISIDGVTTGDYAEATSRTNYLSMASLINIGSPGKSNTLFFGIGPRFDLLINRSYGKFGFNNTVLTDRNVDELGRYVFGGTIVAGIKNISINGINFRLEAKYEADVTNSYQNEPRQLRNSACMMVLGISF